MTTKTPIARRDFLRGVALLGGTALGVLPGIAHADRLGATVTPIDSSSTGGTVSLGFQRNGRFVAAETLAAGDASMERVRLTITSVGNPGIQAIEAHAPVPGQDRVPFTAWVRAPAGMERTLTHLATEPDGGIVLTFVANGVRNTVALGGGRAAGAKIQEGTYLLMAGRTNWNAVLLDDLGGISMRGNVPADYVVPKLERN